jgi:hypothetical protein
MRKSWLAFLPLLVLLASGRASHANATDSPLSDNVGVGEISGGEKSNPLWASEIGNDEFRAILKSALNSTGLLERAKGEGRFLLNANLERIDQPDVCLNPEMTTHVKYTLTDKVSGKIVYQETVLCEYMMQTWDWILRPKRLRIATESAARANAGQLTDKLSHLNLSQEEASLPH